MAIAFVQQTTFVNPNVGFNTSAQTAGNTNFIEVMVAGTSTAPTGVGDTKNGAYTLVTSTGGTTIKLYLYSFFNIAAASAGVNQLTLTNPTGATRVVYVGHEFSGVANTLDGSAVTGTGSGTAASAPITTTNAADLLLSLTSESSAGTITGGSGYTTLWTDTSIAPGAGAQYQIVSATGTYNGNFTVPNGTVWIALQIAYKAATGGSVNPNLSGNLLITGTQAVVPGVIVSPITTGVLSLTGRVIISGLTPPPVTPAGTQGSISAILKAIGYI